MARPDGPQRGGSDADGVRVERRPARAWDVWLLAALAVAIVGWMVLGRDRVDERATAPAGERAVAAADDPAVVPPSPAAPQVDAPGDERGASSKPSDPSPDARLPASPQRRRVLARRLARQLPRTRGPDGKPEIDAADAIAALRAAGVRDGIAAFPPPGTDPPKAGVIVPEGFVLPEGFIRHHQATDDGKPLPPILLVHPDYELIGPDGEPVPLGPDRVVPPELVPEALEIEMLEVPERGAGRTP